MLLNVKFVRNVIPDCSVIAGNDNEVMHSFSVDSRTLKKDDIFVACIGEHLDGHNFIQHALDNGASGLFINYDQQDLIKKIDKKFLEKIIIIAFDDASKAITTIAAAWRNQFSCPVICITGSVGKTSTKTIVGNILALQGTSALISEGNHNTLLGVSLAILKMRESHKVVVLELGIQKRGEMASLVELARPTAAVITIIGHSHMEGLGSINDIAIEKRDVFKFFKEDSIGIINGDQPLLAHCAYWHPVIKFGSKTTNQVQARKIINKVDQTTFILKLYGQKYKITLNSVHKGVVFNALAAASVAYLLGVDSETIVKGIQMPCLVPGRFECLELKVGKGFMINDCYNANPESMKAALAALQAMKTNGQKIAILGDMLELGVNSAFWHRQLGRFLRKVPTLRQVILVGSQVVWTKKTLPLGVKVDLVATWQDAVAVLRSKLDQELTVLVKGSNGVGLTNLVTMFT